LARHDKRLARDFGHKRFGDEGHAIKELRSAFPCADLKLAPEPREGHAACIGSWLEPAFDRAKYERIDLNHGNPR
jgi:antirestriction protein ArdC